MPIAICPRASVIRSGAGIRISGDAIGLNIQVLQSDFFPLASAISACPSPGHHGNSGMPVGELARRHPAHDQRNGKRARASPR